MAIVNSDNEFKERIIKAVKKEVKQIMEEAVTRKFVHQDSGCITSLCAAVESCLSHGLRRRALGLFRTSSTTALLHKVAKSYQPAEIISKLVLEAEASEGLKRSSSSGDSTTRLLLSTSKPPLQKRHSGSLLSRSSGPKYLWIRLALFEKVLVGIVEYLVENSSKFYEKDALVADPEYGSVLCHLLVGPCALEYTRMKTQDHYWTDPPADELVQRHRISSGCNVTSPANKRPGLYLRKLIHGTSSCEENTRNFPSTAKDYVESLHQNNKVVLLYGKNNVRVLPRDHTEVMAGYLSLHQTSETLILKWTPNQLMSGAIDSDGAVDKGTTVWRPFLSPSFCPQYSYGEPFAFWDYALNVNLQEIVYVHCHQQGSDAGGTIVLVGQDGVQRPAIHFPAGGHLLSFLSCLEAGLQAFGRLDPPLWSQTGKGVLDNIKSTENGNEEDNESADYVFRIILNNATENTSNEESQTPGNPPNSAVNPKSPRWWISGSQGRAFRFSESSVSSTSSSKSLTNSMSLAEANNDSNPASDSGDSPPAVKIPQKKGESLQVLCETMKRQIISRAFYGWLAHCRHLRTVRTHLSGLVNPDIISCTEPDDASCGVDETRWKQLLVDGVIRDSAELYRLTYYGGVAHHLRKQVWPYLLGHYPFGSTADEREAQDNASRTAYETTMSEWLALEAIIRQRDKETTAASIAKLSSGSHSEDSPDQRQGSPANEVFNYSDDEDADVEEVSKDVEDRDIKMQEEQLTSITECSVNEVDTQDTDRTVPGSLDIPRVEVPHIESADQVDGPKDEDDGNNDKDDELVNKEVADFCSQKLCVDDAHDKVSLGSRSPCISPASSQGGVYTTELLESFALNLHRIDKDVQRCDRNYWYFTNENLEKLRNIMCTYVWCHLDTGYMQGMCDLVAPLLVILDDEALSYSCFCQLMKRMESNFPHGGAMDMHLANMRSLIQILDAEIFDLMHQNGDYTHFYFCYRWFLLDFKRELLYDDVFTVWETIWSARHISSSHFVLFVALALVQYYRDIILTNAMDFTDIIKFFNEMAERHDAKAILQLARDLVLQLQTLIEK